MGASQPTVSILVPYRPDGGQRDRVWAWCQAEWAKTGLELVVDDGDGPNFSLAQSVNRAARRATGDIFVTCGADFVPYPDVVREAVGYLKAFPWVQLFSNVCYLDETSTEQILATGEIGNPVVDVLTDRCMGIVAVPRATWEDIDGYDERFVGWGPEDHAFVNVLATLFGPGLTLGRYAVHLWHPPALQVEPNFDLYDTEYVPAIGDPERMRALVSGRR